MARHCHDVVGKMIATMTPSLAPLMLRHLLVLRRYAALDRNIEFADCGAF